MPKCYFPETHNTNRDRLQYYHLIHNQYNNASHTNIMWRKKNNNKDLRRRYITYIMRHWQSSKMNGIKYILGVLWMCQSESFGDIQPVMSHALFSAQRASNTCWQLVWCGVSLYLIEKLVQPFISRRIRLSGLDFKNDKYLPMAYPPCWQLKFLKAT